MDVDTGVTEGIRLHKTQSTFKRVHAAPTHAVYFPYFQSFLCSDTSVSWFRAPPSSTWELKYPLFKIQPFFPYCDQVHVLDALGAAVVNMAQCQEADPPVVS